jgi:phosphatidylserine decarboxylase
MIKDAYLFIIPMLGLIALCLFFGLSIPALVLVVLTCFVAYFFRNPARTIPAGEHLVVSPADGKVVRVSLIPDVQGEPPGRQNISIFLNIFDVHVTRSPIKGELERLEYKRGKFKAAFDDEASRVNEQNILTIRGARIRVVVKQVAGLIARRVICWRTPGNALERGELFGLIRFGSRVDVILPREVRILVKVGERVKGGSSVIGEVI